MSARQVLAWIFVLLLVLFVVFNLDRASVWFFGIQVVMPIALVVLFSAALGAGATVLFARMKKRGSGAGR
ncbi:MAG TPA: hypothetical protein VM509_10540 [Planctomycetota bacterium]|nr:hypothetical protein [Planctomycetota bacterium]